MKLYIVRHGQCVANMQGVVAGGGNDSPLTESGLQDAQKSIPSLIDARIDTIVSSPLVRANQTAEIIRKGIRLSSPIKTMIEFTERNVGIASGLPLEEYFAMEKSGTAIEGAETATEMFERVQRGVKKLRSINAVVLLVTHNGTYRMLQCVLSGVPAAQFILLEGLKNGEVKELEI